MMVDLHGNRIADGGETVLTMVTDQEPAVVRMTDGDPTTMLVVEAAKAMLVLLRNRHGRTDIQKERASLHVVVIAPSPQDERAMTIEVKDTLPVRRADRSVKGSRNPLTLLGLRFCRLCPRLHQRLC